MKLIILRCLRFVRLLVQLSLLLLGAPQDTENPVGPYPIIENRGQRIVPVVQAYAFTKYLGKLVLTFDREKNLISAVGGPILLDKAIPQGNLFSIIRRDW